MEARNAPVQGRSVGRSESVNGSAHERLFALLYQANYQRLRVFLRRFLSSAADADEVAHDAFLRLFRSDLTAYDDPAAVLFKTGHRLALNRIRARRCNPLEHADEIGQGEVLASSSETAEEAMLSREREGAYHRAIASLPPRCREVIELRTVHDLSYKEMSVRLGLSVSTLEKHIVKGKKMCVDAIAAWQSDGLGRPRAAA